jgi:hypothetical protein
MTGVNGSRLTELFDQHAREILGFLVRRTSDPEAAVDLLAETFAAAFEGRGEFRGRIHALSERGCSRSRETCWLTTSDQSEPTVPRFVGWGSSGVSSSIVESAGPAA